MTTKFRRVLLFLFFSLDTQIARGPPSGSLPTLSSSALDWAVLLTLRANPSQPTNNGISPLISADSAIWLSIYQRLCHPPIWRNRHFYRQWWPSSWLSLRLSWLDSFSHFIELIFIHLYVRYPVTGRLDSASNRSEMGPMHLMLFQNLMSSILHNSIAMHKIVCYVIRFKQRRNCWGGHDRQRRWWRSGDVSVPTNRKSSQGYITLRRREKENPWAWAVFSWVLFAFLATKREKHVKVSSRGRHCAQKQQRPTRQFPPTKKKKFDTSCKRNWQICFKLLMNSTNNTEIRLCTQEIRYVFYGWQMSDRPTLKTLSWLTGLIVR